MAAIGRFQKGDEIFFAKVVDGEIFRLQGDVFGSPSFDRKPTRLKGLRTLTPVAPSKVAKVATRVAGGRCRGTRRSPTSVTIPNVPSDPTNNFVSDSPATHP